MDILLDDSGNFVTAANGDFELVSGVDELKQELKHEFETNKGDLFYDKEYGFSLTDFINSPLDNLMELELKERIRTGLINKEYVNKNTIEIDIIEKQLNKSVLQVKFETNNREAIQLGISIDDTVKVVVI
ncbi:DUF2634 domain-containing protein [Vallitalea guaymasensis]|uniref:contractile injection system sheath initiator n=1 Tax=Vallitalea guaymasensis TaxID=1185412 RepID=UPI000DE34B6C|nr:DUF2634 domain-containing protein [Vallitalea guaymasensis]